MRGKLAKFKYFIILAQDCTIHASWCKSHQKFQFQLETSFTFSANSIYLMKSSYGQRIALLLETLLLTQISKIKTMLLSSKLIFSQVDETFLSSPNHFSCSSSKHKKYSVKTKCLSDGNYFP